MVLDTLEQIALSMVAITTVAVQEVAGPELTFLGWRVLVVAGANAAPMRSGDLALALRISRPSASKVIRRLLARGLVDLVIDPVDRRGVLVILTTDGRRIRTAVLDRRRQILDQALAVPLPEQFEPALETLAGRLEQWS